MKLFKDFDIFLSSILRGPVCIHKDANFLSVAHLAWAISFS